MKTKIIYISGSEVFEMADVRAAFEEVRTTLGLGRDTILFGVPVDNDDALATPQEAAPKIEITQPSPVIEEASVSPIIENIIESKQEEQIDDTPVIEDEAEDTPIIEEIVPEPVKKSRGRPRKTATEVASDAADIPQEETVTESVQSEKVIPILSVLAAKSAPMVEETAPQPDAIEDDMEEVPVEEIEETIVAAADETPDDKSLDTDTIEDIDEMIADQAPEEPIEKTLEQLLESMTPLREDHGDANIVDMDDDSVVMSDSATIAIDDNADATLEQLATEFADTADSIATPAPAPSQGKIGKLKNILPFKKARRDDTGLMGDLFGWAGVAANDEDFTIPGFFTTAASKK